MFARRRFLVIDKYFKLAQSSTKGVQGRNSMMLNKKKYVLFDKEDCEWQMLYCNNHKDETETGEEILRSMISCKFAGKFHADEYSCINRAGIKNDKNIYIMNEDGVLYLWQVGSKVSDMEEFIIPHTYYIRKVGILVV